MAGTIVPAPHHQEKCSQSASSVQRTPNRHPQVLTDWYPLWTTRANSVLDAPTSFAIYPSHVVSTASAMTRETPGTSAIMSALISARASFARNI